MMQGAHTGAMNRLRRPIAGARARDLCAFVVPGPDVARARGLNLAMAGLHLAATPRHANVLLIAGPLPPGLRDAATVAYAQMPRPRAILALGAGDLAPLPVADATGPLTQAGLVAALADLRRVVATGAFAAEVTDFDAPALQTRIEYTCPMHPEVVSDTPGNCPKCGMTLMPKETSAGGHSGHQPKEITPAHQPPAAAHAAHDHTVHTAAAEAPAQFTCPMHPEVLSDAPGSCPKCGMFLVPVEAKAEDHSGHHHHDHGKHTAANAPAQYTCPMHPEVVSDAPGNCPKCGMFLVPVEEKAKDHSGHGHHHGKHTDAAAPAQYTCPLHPEVLSDAPGSCPECGMFLVPVEEKAEGHSGHDHGGHDHQQHDHKGHDHHTHADTGQAHKGHDHAGHDGHAGHGGHAGHTAHTGGEAIDGIEPHFMSMVDLTRDMPASADGLKMEWIEVPFGPFFPGLPGGLGLILTLDGDAVAETQAQSLVAGPVAAEGMTPAEFAGHLADLSPLSPVAGRHLACLALENAAGAVVDTKTATARAAAVERERITSHLGWLASFAVQTGLVWMERRAAALQLSVQAASADQIAAGTGPLRVFLHRVRKTPLLLAKLAGNGRIGAGKLVVGPIARAQGIASDARAGDPVYDALGFQIVTGMGDDALARLHQRCDEIDQSLDLIARAKDLSGAKPDFVSAASGQGEAMVETPRGAARLTVDLREGKLVSAKFEPPSVAHMDLLADLIGAQEIADALVAVGSLDLSPWGLPA